MSAANGKRANKRVAVAVTAECEANAALRRPQVLQLRIKGYSFREIGKELGVSHVQAWEDYQHAKAELKQLESDTVEEYRRVALVRLDALLVKLQPAIDKGDVRAITAAVKIEQRRADLLGLDAPKKVSVEEDWKATPFAKYVEQAEEKVH